MGPTPAMAREGKVYYRRLWRRSVREMGEGEGGGMQSAARRYIA